MFLKDLKVEKVTDLCNYFFRYMQAVVDDIIIPQVLPNRVGSIDALFLNVLRCI
jgi:hypothetical protein